MLKGIKVIDFSQNVPGPYATLRLANLEAEVIKIEPKTGESARFSRDNPKEESNLFKSMNRGKKSIALDLKNIEDQNLARDLIKKADVLIESFRPGVLSKLGLGYPEVSQINSKIIYCSLSGYGQNGPLHQFGSHDLNYMALSGVLSQLTDKDNRPVHPSITLADLIGGIAASESIVAALFQREKTGKGCYLDVSILDVMISMMSIHSLIESVTGEESGLRVLNKNVICYYLYETSDGRFISFGALESKFWKNFCYAAGKPEWLSAQFTPPNPDNPIFLEIQGLFKSKSYADWVAFSQEVDCCMAPVVKTSEIHQQPYVKERKLLFNENGIRQTVTHYSQSKEEKTYPKLDEHDIEILKKVK
ncbi:alpha-methylacyl-CoA racemase [Neobacillus niacini]|uniref:CaiB/BaiF CoA transferase family protein n=1 Tax=Neobacillus niacini TaxID=86668 RepID=UPI00277D767F|nr:CaiB/BaiF CoA-transferase family protein [Neobacillus niacini]MDQ1002186.1 alpha-methylacyl-CoA racemase [Neobacillus niacini]